MIDQILKLTKQLKLDVYYQIILTYMTILSESPDIFVELTREIQRGNRFLKGDDIGNIAWLFYKEVWKIKDAKRIGKKITPHLKL